MNWRIVLLKLIVRWMFRSPRDVWRFAAGLYPDNVALITPEGRFTYFQLDERVRGWTGLLWTRGLRKGHRVFSLLSDGLDNVALRLACIESGVALAPFHAAHGADFLTNAASLVRPNLFIYDPVLGEAAAQRMSDLWGGDFLVPADKGLEKKLAADRRRSTASIDDADVYGLGFTSGTSGDPKCLLTSHGAYIRSLQLIVANIEVVHRRPTRQLGAIPLAGAGAGLLLPTLLTGGAFIIPPDFQTDTLLRVARDEAATGVFLTPSELIDLLDHPDFNRDNLPALRQIIYGTAPMPAAKIEEVLRRFGPVLMQGYGMAEVLPPVSTLNPPEHMAGDVPASREVLRSAGRPVPQVQVSVAGPAGAVLPRGEIGEIMIKSPTVFSGYWLRPDLTAKRLRNGWIFTEDMGYVDKEGRLMILDRKQDLIARGGRAVYPRDVEEVVHEHPSVREACLVARPGTNQMVLCVSLWRRRPHDAPEDARRGVEALLAERLEPWQRPDEILIWDQIPRSPLAKLSRRAAREKLAKAARP